VGGAHERAGGGEDVPKNSWNSTRSACARRGSPRPSNQPANPDVQQGPKGKGKKAGAHREKDLGLLLCCGRLLGI
jgi:hypothetical protein